MKKTVMALVILVCAAAMVTAQKPLGPPTAWYALEEGSAAFHTWIPSDSNFTFNLTESLLPEGFVIAKNGGNVEMRLDPGPVGVQQAMIVVNRDKDIGGTWTGPKVTVREEAVIEIIRYSSTLDPFFGGQGHVILSASDPNE